MDNNKYNAILSSELFSEIIKKINANTFIDSLQCVYPPYLRYPSNRWSPSAIMVTSKGIERVFFNTREGGSPIDFSPIISYSQFGYQNLDSFEDIEMLAKCLVDELNKSIWQKDGKRVVISLCRAVEIPNAKKYYVSDSDVPMKGSSNGHMVYTSEQLRTFREDPQHYKCIFPGSRYEHYERLVNNVILFQDSDEKKSDEDNTAIQLKKPW